ncbi:MAG: FkbM family methyltransferase [Pseudomonadota bacterium]
MTVALDTTSAFGTRKAQWHERAVWAASDWSALPASLRRRLRKRFARPVEGPFDVKQDGMKLRLYPAENHCDRVIFGRRRLPERAEHEALLPYLSNGMTFVDVGGNVGSYSCYVGTRAKAARIVAFEPHPRTVEKLRFNLAANGLQTDDVVNCALGEREETLQLWSDGGSNIGHTSLLPEGTANAKVSVDVPVRVLPQVLAERGVVRVDMLKIDIEGFEDRALAPLLEANEALWPKVVLIETAHQHLWERDVLAMLRDRGYEVRFETGENMLVVRS